MLRNYIGVRVKVTYISDKEWKDIKRPAGINNIIYMHHKYPTDRQINTMRAELKDDQCLLIFNPDDTLRFMGRK